jgi:hypothetical protein
MAEPTQIPEKGFYMHYKHDPNGKAFNFMYEVIGIGRNTEEKTFTVLYRPLYVNDWMTPADYQSKPIEIFLESVDKDGKTMPRFIRIIDPELISKLEESRNELYGRK